MYPSHIIITISLPYHDRQMVLITAVTYNKLKVAYGIFTVTMYVTGLTLLTGC